MAKRPSSWPRFGQRQIAGDMVASKLFGADGGVLIVVAIVSILYPSTRVLRAKTEMARKKKKTSPSAKKRLLLLTSNQRATAWAISPLCLTWGTLGSELDVAFRKWQSDTFEPTSRMTMSGMCGVTSASSSSHETEAPTSARPSRGGQA